MATQDEINYQNQLASQRRWYARNKEKRAALNKEYKMKNKERLAAARRRLDAAKKAGTWERRQKGGDYARRRLYVYKQNAKDDGRTWALSDEEAVALIIGVCNYCGAPANATNGIDRVDSAGGYTPDNVISACWTCNRMKGVMKMCDFITHIKKIYENKL